MTEQLFPRKPRRMKQPTKALLREYLDNATRELERVKAENERLRMPWWRRIIRSKAA